MGSRGVLVLAGGIAAVLAAATACAGATDGAPSDSPTGSPSGSPTGSATGSPPRRPASCGRVPTSTGPAAPLASVRVSGPRSAALGATIPVQVAVDVRADGPRIVTVPAASRLLITRGADVVGRSEPGVGPAGVPVVLKAGATRPAQAVPESVTLVGCPDGGSAGPPLPPGRYGIVAVLAYGQDPLQGNASGGGAKQFVLVSAPWAIAVQ